MNILYISLNTAYIVLLDLDRHANMIMSQVIENLGFESKYMFL